MDTKIEDLTVEDCDKWTQKLVDQGDIAASTGNGKRTALKQMADQRAPDEPRNLRWMADNMEMLAGRWARKNSGNGKTAGIYAARAKDAVEEYLRFYADPVAYRTNVQAPKMKRDKKVPMEETTAQPSAAKPQPESNSFRVQLENGSFFEMSFQGSALTMGDLKKIGRILHSFVDEPGVEPWQTGGGNAAGGQLPARQ